MAGYFIFGNARSQYTRGQKFAIRKACSLTALLFGGAPQQPPGAVRIFRKAQRSLVVSFAKCVRAGVRANISTAASYPMFGVAKRRLTKLIRLPERTRVSSIGAPRAQALSSVAFSDASNIAACVRTDKMRPLFRYAMGLGTPLRSGGTWTPFPIYTSGCRALLDASLIEGPMKPCSCNLLQNICHWFQQGETKVLIAIRLTILPEEFGTFVAYCRGFTCVLHNNDFLNVVRFGKAHVRENNANNNDPPFWPVTPRVGSVKSIDSRVLATLPARSTG